MDDFEEVLKGKYPAKAHAVKVTAYLKSQDPSADGLIYLEGQKTRMIDDNDEPVPFRQRRPFYYLSGCALPDSYLTYNTRTTHLTLFIPPIDPSSVIWSGLPISPAEALALYDVDAVLPTTSLSSFLASADATSPSSCVFAIPEQVSQDVTFLAFERKEMKGLREAIEECRVTKDTYEVALIRKANVISTLAHSAVLHAAATATNERELEAVFIAKCIANGCREQAYHSIVASGTNAATLHYQHNNQPLAGRQNLLLDAGGEYSCYCADITRTFPLSGAFTDASLDIYHIVSRMQSTCTSLLRAGVLWDDVHARAHEIAIDGLLQLGILKGGTAREIFEARTSVAFFPHGLGHYLGMDTHDTGGHADYEDKDPMYKYLRVRGKLPAGAVVTVEPGIYFCRFIVEPYLEDEVHGKYIDKEVLEDYWDVGGVRIEDNVLITKDGYENLTTAVKGVDEMCGIINGGKA